MAIAAETAGCAGISHIAPSAVGIDWNVIRSAPKYRVRAEMSWALPDHINTIAARAAETASHPF
jgi:hypothetical protein